MMEMEDCIATIIMIMMEIVLSGIYFKFDWIP